RIFPGAALLESEPSLCRLDADGDGYGERSLPADLVDAGVLEGTDCLDDAADADAAVTFPGAGALEADASVAAACVTDRDGDQYADDAPAAVGVTAGTDCDDGEAAFHPGAAEVPVDGIDQDCNVVDSCYQDLDGDAFGTASLVDAAGMSCAADPTVAVVPTDCNDADAAVFPGAAGDAVGDEVDQDCDGRETCYVDADRDGYGDDGHGASVPSTVLSPDTTCDAPGESTAARAVDCDDTKAAIRPDATEGVADGVDQDCDGLEDCYADVDHDGRGTDALLGNIVTDVDLTCGSIGRASTNDDCDDARADVTPGRGEAMVADGVDDNCDGVELCYVDADDDGARDATAYQAGSDSDCDDANEALATAQVDCRDDEPSRYPGANDIPADGIDSNCDGNEACHVDNDGDGVSQGTVATPAYVTRTVTAGSVAACAAAGFNGAGDPVGDCNDTAGVGASIAPGADDAAADGIDSNCDGIEQCYGDVDGDGYRNAVLTAQAVTAGTTTGCPTSLGQDCNDASAAVKPGATETAADGIDSNCDASEQCYSDADGDGFRDTALVTYGVTAGSSGNCAAALPGGGTRALGTASTDCLDTGTYAAATYPRTNGVAGWLDASGCKMDADGDHYGASTVTGGVSAGTDCDDDPTAHGPDAAHSGSIAANEATGIRPNATDTPVDGINQDCSQGDTCYVDADSDTFGSTSTLSSADLDCADPDVSGATDEADDATDCLDTGTNAASAFPGAAPNDNAADCMMDADGDDWGSTARLGATGGIGTDCLDSGTGPGGELASAVKPSGTEVCDANNFDEDCDGTADDADATVSATGKGTFYADADGDGWENRASPSALLCDAPTGYMAARCTAAQVDPTAPGTSPNCDCNDVSGSGGSINPSATEVCDASDVDEDCDGTADDSDASATGKSSWYADADGDTYTVGTGAVSRCDAPANTRALSPSLDCDDTSKRTYPGATEYCDGVKTDCSSTGSATTSEYGLISFAPDANADGTVDDANADGMPDWSNLSPAGGFRTAGSPDGITASGVGTYYVCAWPSTGVTYDSSLRTTPTASAPTVANTYYTRITVASGVHGVFEGRATGTPTITLNAGTAAASATNRVLTVASGGRGTLRNVVVRGGRVSGGFGGGISVTATGAQAFATPALTLTNVTVTDNVSSLGGGGVYVATTARASIDASTLSANCAGSLSAGVCTTTTTSYGGGIYLSGTARADIRSSVISSNTGIFGGGLYLGAGTTAGLQDTQVTTNSGKHATAAAGGGGAYVAGNGASLYAYSSAGSSTHGFYTNVGDNYGGGMWINSTGVTCLSRMDFGTAAAERNTTPFSTTAPDDLGASTSVTTWSALGNNYSQHFSASGGTMTARALAGTDNACRLWQCGVPSGTCSSGEVTWP
ncbi:MAG: hypothetical protein RLZZ383_1884, partial [Pseudomonadota bacterium]